MAQKKQIKKGGMSAGKMAAIGAGVAAVSAGAYYFMGPEGKAHQKKAEAWVKGMEQKIEKKAKPALKQAKSAITKTVKTVEKLTKKEKPMVMKADKKFIEALKKIEKTAKKEISKTKKALKK